MHDICSFLEVKHMKVLKYKSAPVNISELNITLCVEGMLLKINLLKIGIHVESRRSEVVSARDIWHHTLTSFPYFWHPHPHIPVPHLKFMKKKRLSLDTNLCEEDNAQFGNKQ